MGKTAVLAFAAGEALIHHVFGSAVSDALSGVGQFLIGLAAAVAAVSGMRNGRKLTHANRNAEVAADRAVVAANKADVAATVSADLSKSIGPSNGTNVLQLLHEIKAFEEYQHNRNHDILAGLSQLGVATPLLMSLLERVADLLQAEQNGRRDQSPPNEGV